MEVQDVASAVFGSPGIAPPLRGKRHTSTEGPWIAGLQRSIPSDPGIRGSPHPRRLRCPPSPYRGGYASAGRLAGRGASTLSVHGLFRNGPLDAGGLRYQALAIFARSLPIPLDAIFSFRRDTPQRTTRYRNVPPLRGTPRIAPGPPVEVLLVCAQPRTGTFLRTLPPLRCGPRSCARRRVPDPGAPARGGVPSATLATLRPLAAGSDRRDFFLSAGHSSNRTTDNLQECPPASSTPPHRLGPPAAGAAAAGGGPE